MQLLSTLALATSAAALVAPAAPKASTKLDVATLKNPSSTEFAYGLPGNEIPGVPSSRFDFDPLGFAERASPAEMVKYREAELKHGRVAMLAITGMLFAEVWHPMLYAPSNVPAIFAFQGTLQQSSILAPVLLAIGAVETASFPGWEPTDFKMKDGYVPGSRATAHKSKFRDLHAIDATSATTAWRCGLQHDRAPDSPVDFRPGTRTSRASRPGPRTSSRPKSTYGRKSSSSTTAALPCSPASASGPRSSCNTVSPSCSRSSKR